MRSSIRRIESARIEFSTAIACAAATPHASALILLFAIRNEELRNCRFDHIRQCLSSAFACAQMIEDMNVLSGNHVRECNIKILNAFISFTQTPRSISSISAREGKKMNIKTQGNKKKTP
jgi:hypothetical protein